MVRLLASLPIADRILFQLHDYLLETDYLAISQYGRIEKVLKVD